MSMFSQKVQRQSEQRIIIKSAGQRFEIYEPLPGGPLRRFVSIRTTRNGRKQLAFYLPSYGELGALIGQLIMDGADTIRIYHTDIFGVRQALVVHYGVCDEYGRADMQVHIRPAFHIGWMLSWIPRKLSRLVFAPLRWVL